MSEERLALAALYQKQKMRPECGEIEQQGLAAHRRRDRARRASTRPTAASTAQRTAPGIDACRAASCSPCVRMRLHRLYMGLCRAGRQPRHRALLDRPVHQRPRTGRARSRSTTSHHTTWWRRKDSPPATGRRTSPPGATGTPPRTASTSSACRRRWRPGSRSAARSRARTARAACSSTMIGGGRDRQEQQAQEDEAAPEVDQAQPPALLDEAARLAGDDRCR